LTCIASFRHHDKIYMACDSAFTFHPEEQVTVAEDPKKIITCPLNGGTEQVLVGVAGSMDYLCILHEELGDLGIGAVTFSGIKADIDVAFKDDDELWRKFPMGSDPACILVAIGNKLYRIATEHSWIEVADDIYAVGSGADLAIGALSALQLSARPSDIDADVVRSWLRTALLVAATYDVGVKKPFHLTNTVSRSDQEK